VTGGLPDDVAPTVRDLLEPGEAVLGFVTSLAATLVLTDGRIIIAREGRSWRPSSGIRTWRIWPTLPFSWRRPHGGVGRLVVGKGRAQASFFVPEAEMAEALRLIGLANAIAQDQKPT
jgi:hypothetical protein